MKKEQLEQCINEYGKDIYSFCRHLTCNQQEADDLYQDTFLKAVELEEKIDYKNNPKSFLLSIALRIWKNRKRKFAWRKRIMDIGFFEDGREDEFKTAYKSNSEKSSGNFDEGSYENSPEEWIIKKEEAELIRQLVERLPEKLKIVILLFYMEEQSVAEIASILKIPQGTVKSRLYQARKQLEKELEVVLNETKY